jgi:hypothetical protein
VEPHKDWTPHYHLLVHEVHPLLPIPQRRLSGIWPHGHTAFRLAKTDKVAFYAAKYLAKCSVARVRASKNYGQEYDLEITGPKEGDVKRGQIDPPTAPFFSSREEETGFDWTQGPENGRGMETDQ